MLVHHGSMITLEHYLIWDFEQIRTMLREMLKKFTFFTKSKQSKKKNLEHRTLRSILDDIALSYMASTFEDCELLD